MINLDPTAVDVLAVSVTELTGLITDTVPLLGNGHLCVDSTCTAGRACINFYTSPNLLSRVFFGASAVCGAAGALSSGVAVVTSYAGIPATAYVGSVGARGFNRLGRYKLHLGNVTSGDITNVAEIAELMN